MIAGAVIVIARSDKSIGVPAARSRIPCIGIGNPYIQSIGAIGKPRVA